MTRDCPDCGDPLIQNTDGGYTCIQCGNTWDADDAPEPTGTPLDVGADASGRVRMQVPDPRRGMDSRPVRMAPDAARRLAEGLEMAADDAERREDREGEPIPDGGEELSDVEHRSERPPQSIRGLDFQNVTGADASAFTLGNKERYRGGKVVLWAGEDPDDAEPHAFSLDYEQVHKLARVFAEMSSEIALKSGGDGEPLTDGGEREPSAITVQFRDNNPEDPELTPEFISDFLSNNSEYELETVTFRAMTEGEDHD